MREREGLGPEPQYQPDRSARSVGKQREGRPTSVVPGGTKIAYESEVTDGSGQMDILITDISQNVTPGTTINLTNTSNCIEGKPVWSSDGKWIYYSRRCNGSTDDDILKERSDDSSTVPSFIVEFGNRRVPARPIARQHALVLHARSRTAARLPASTSWISHSPVRGSTSETAAPAPTTALGLPEANSSRMSAVRSRAVPWCTSRPTTAAWRSCSRPTRLTTSTETPTGHRFIRRSAPAGRSR